MCARNQNMGDWVAPCYVYTQRRSESASSWYLTADPCLLDRRDTLLRRIKMHFVLW